MAEERKEGSPGWGAPGAPGALGALGAPPTESTAAAHLSAARSLVREGQLLLRETIPIPKGVPPNPRQLQNLLHVYQLCEQALKHLDACGLPIGPAAAAAAGGRKVQYEQQPQQQQQMMLSESMAKAGKAQGFFALVTMAEALRAMGKSCSGSSSCCCQY